MDNEVKTCKYCKETIPKKCKRCPKCGGKFGLPGIVKVLLFIVVLFIVVIALISSCANAVDEAIDETTNSYQDINGKTSFALNETFENSYIKMTMTEVNTNYTNYSEYFGPESGNVIIAAKFEVENIGDTDEYISMYDFNAYADGVAVDYYYYSNDSNDISATISSGKIASGYVYFEVPSSASSITIEYQASVLDSINIEFVVK